MIKVKRVYDPADPADGYRVLVDRLWPRGLTKEAAKLDKWLKEIAPSPGLRTWYGHLVEKWPEFIERYRRELASDESRAHLAKLKRLAEQGPVTLLFAAKDEEHNSALVVRDAITVRGGLQK